MPIPKPELDPADILLGLDDEMAPPAKRPEPEAADDMPDEEPVGEPVKPRVRDSAKPARSKTTAVSQLPPLTTNDPPFWRRHLHWLLALAMIPLAISLMSNSPSHDIADRLEETLLDAPVEVQVQFLSKLKTAKSLDELIGVLPGERIKGAWLPRSTYVHWLFGLLATAAFLVFFMFLASDGSANAKQVLIVGLVTATVGVGILLIIQSIASMTHGRVVIGRSILVILFWIFKFIDFSYTAAADPENGFVLSYFGFLLGVGLFEELVKLVPLFWHSEEEGSTGKTWRGLFIWGLASGAGFGIAEGILYSSRYYNGISGGDMYLVRFISCVALHAIWSGSVAITLYLNRERFSQLAEWTDWIGPILLVIGLPMVFHALYDTCLKRDMNGMALLVAVASFGWLAFLSSRLYGTDDEEAKEDMLKEYKRRRKMMG
jgi:RsiW-degrading membrane proteinase PrsW (M82 family)